MLYPLSPKQSFVGFEGNRAALGLNMNADKEGASLNEFMKGCSFGRRCLGRPG